MNKRRVSRIFNKTTSLLFALMLSVSSFFTHVDLRALDLGVSKEGLPGSSENETKISEDVTIPSEEDADAQDDASTEKDVSDGDDPEIEDFLILIGGPNDVHITLDEARNTDVILNAQGQRVSVLEDFILRMVKPHRYSSNPNATYWINPDDMKKLSTLDAIRSDTSTYVKLLARSPRPADTGDKILQIVLMQKIDRDVHEGLRAFDFSMSLSDLRKLSEGGLTDPNSEFATVFKKEADLIAVEVHPEAEFPRAIESEITIETPRPTTVGHHDVTFRAPKGTELTVKVNVTDIEADAHGTALGVDELEELTEKKLEALVGAQGKTINLKDGDQDDVIFEFDKDDFQALKNMKKGQEDPININITAKNSTGDEKKLDPVPIYVYDAVNAGRSYGINANNFDLMTSKLNRSVAEANAALIEAAGAKGYDLTGAEPKQVGEDDIAVVADLNKIKSGGSAQHPVKFQIKGTDAEVEVTGRFTDDVKPIITADAYVVYNKGEVKNEEAFLTDIHASLDKAGIITSDFEKEADLGTVGAYVITVDGTDEAGNKAEATKQVVVLVKDEETDVQAENDMMIRAKGFTLDVSKLEGADFVGLAEAAAWRISTGEAVAVELASDAPTTRGDYKLEYKAERASKTVDAKITDLVQPKLSADAYVVYNKGEVKNEEAFLTDIHASLDKAGIITSDFEKEVDLNKVGVYKVTVKGKDLAENASNIVETMVLVRDGEHTVIDEAKNVMLTAYDFAVLLSEVPSADFVALARAEAWDITSGAGLEVVLSSEKPTTGGNHDVVFSANEVTKDVKANVQDNAIVIEADDVAFSLADLNALKASNGLADETLKRSKAKAYVRGTGEQVTPLTADVSALMNAEIKGGETFDVVIAYQGQATFADVLDEAASTSVSKVIKVSVAKEEATPTPDKGPKLPITGENITMLLTGLVTIVASVGLLFFVFFYRRRKNKQEGQ